MVNVFIPSPALGFTTIVCATPAFVDAEIKLPNILPPIVIFALLFVST
jgi:hypothetical protein